MDIVTVLYTWILLRIYGFSVLVLPTLHHRVHCKLHQYIRRKQIKLQDIHTPKKKNPHAHPIHRVHTYNLAIMYTQPLFVHTYPHTTLYNYTFVLTCTTSQVAYIHTSHLLLPPLVAESLLIKPKKNTTNILEISAIFHRNSESQIRKTNHTTGK